MESCHAEIEVNTIITSSSDDRLSVSLQRKRVRPVTGTSHRKEQDTVARATGAIVRPIQRTVRMQPCKTKIFATDTAARSGEKELSIGLKRGRRYRVIGTAYGKAKLARSGTGKAAESRIKRAIAI